MQGKPAFPTLVRRLISEYLLIGLAGILCLLVFALHLAYRGQFTEFVALTTVLPIIVLLAGGFLLRRTVAFATEIEQELVTVSRQVDHHQTTIRQLPIGGEAADGWNRISQRLSQIASIDRLVHRLSQTSESGGQNSERVLNALPDGIAIADRTSSIQQINPAGLAILKLSSDEATGKRVSEVLVQNFGADNPHLHDHLESSARRIAFELHAGKNLTDGVLRVSRSQLDRSGEQTIWCFRDLTPQKLAEEARNQFVLTATHELRTPLTNIRALAETLAFEDDIDIEEQKRFCNHINAEATRLARFVDELLDLSQLEAGALQVTVSDVDLERLVSEVIEHVRPELQHKNIQFETILPAKYPKAKLDKDKITGSLVNLLGNAAKYTPDGGRVQFKVEFDSDLLMFEVEDSGYGISAEELPRVFEKFYRSDDQRVRSVSGSGLGLAFTFEVIRKHGGQIAASSELDKGSRFTIHLPL
ncbi:sensor histidine kinase [Thalassoroseus pseudoceratinae]|uniref:sensor histidine kinase n=1 Tax=Thalassoroseus pseudoceratinae TaxID=2713176 RepID=UPI001423FCA3|nr:ATP-binding protein [Thalassoroseus pseudoceratinae]